MQCSVLIVSRFTLQEVISIIKNVTKVALTMLSYRVVPCHRCIYAFCVNKSVLISREKILVSRVMFHNVVSYHSTDEKIKNKTQKQFFNFIQRRYKKRSKRLFIKKRYTYTDSVIQVLFYYTGIFRAIIH